MALVGLLVALAAAAGAAVAAAPGARLSGDEPHYLLTAISLAEDGDLDIADELASRRYRPFHTLPLDAQGAPMADGQHLSPHDPLLPVLLAPATALGGWLAAKLTLAAMAGLLAALLVWTAVRRLGTPLPAAVLVAGAFGLSPPLAVYATQLYPELPAALATTVAIALLTGRLGPPARWALAASLVALPWLSVKYVPVVATLAGIALVRLCRRADYRPAVRLVVVLAVAAAAYLVLHQRIYGGWTPYAAGGQFASGEFGVMGDDPDHVARSGRLLGLLVDTRFGLAAWQPAWLLAVPALAWLLRRRPPGWAALGLPLAAGWLTAAFLAVRMHGWWWPGRHTVATLPAAVLAVAWWVGTYQPPRATLRWIGAVGVVGYAWLLVEGAAGHHTWVAGFWRTSYPPYQLWRLALPDLQHVGAGTWILGAGWLAVLASLAIRSWRSHQQQRRPRLGNHHPPDGAQLDRRVRFFTTAHDRLLRRLSSSTKDG
jgi:hypothetical protein